MQTSDVQSRPKVFNLQRESTRAGGKAEES
jgi:hypothetical protein